MKPRLQETAKTGAKSKTPAKHTKEKVSGGPGPTGDNKGVELSKAKRPELIIQIPRRAQQSDSGSPKSVRSDIDSAVDCNVELGWALATSGLLPRMITSPLSATSQSSAGSSSEDDKVVVVHSQPRAIANPNPLNSAASNDNYLASSPVHLPALLDEKSPAVSPFVSTVEEVEAENQFKEALHKMALSLGGEQGYSIKSLLAETKEESVHIDNIINFFNMATRAIEGVNLSWFEILLGPQLLSIEEKYHADLRHTFWQKLRLEHSNEIYQLAYDVLNNLCESYPLIQQNEALLREHHKYFDITQTTVLDREKARISEQKASLEKDLKREKEKQAALERTIQSQKGKDEKSAASDLEKDLAKARANILYLEEKISHLKISRNIPIEHERRFHMLEKIHKDAEASEAKEIGGNYKKMIDSQCAYIFELAYGIDINPDTLLKKNTCYVYAFKKSTQDAKSVEFSLQCKLIDNNGVVYIYDFGNELSHIRKLIIAGKDLLTPQMIEQLRSELADRGHFDKMTGYQGYLKKMCERELDAISRKTTGILSSTHIQAVIYRLQVELEGKARDLLLAAQATMKFDLAAPIDSKNTDPTYQVKVRYLKPLLERHYEFLQRIAREFFSADPRAEVFEKFQKNGDLNALRANLKLDTLCEMAKQKLNEINEQRAQFANIKTTQTAEILASFRKHAIQWLSDHPVDILERKEEHGKQHNKAALIKRLVDDIVQNTQRGMDEKVDEFVRRRRRIANLRDAVGNSLLHHVIYHYAQILVDSIDQADKTKSDAQLNDLIAIAKLLHLNGCSPYWCNDAKQDIYQFGNQAIKTFAQRKMDAERARKGTTLAAQEKLRKQLEALSLPDWKWIKIGLEAVLPFSTAGKLLQELLLEYWQKTDNQLHGRWSFLYAFFIDFSIKENRRTSLGGCMQQLYLGQVEISDAIVYDTVKQVLAMAPRGALGGSDLCKKLENWCKTVEQKRLLAFNTPMETIKQIWDLRRSEVFRVAELKMAENIRLTRELEQTRREKEEALKLVAKANAIVEEEKEARLNVVKNLAIYKGIHLDKVKIAEMRQQVSVMRQENRQVNNNMNASATQSSPPSERLDQKAVISESINTRNTNNALDDSSVNKTGIRTDEVPPKSGESVSFRP